MSVRRPGLLDQFSVAELIDEIMRRDIAGAVELGLTPPWCADCDFFIDDPQEREDEDNPCGWGREMDYLCPECPGDTEGYYSIGCPNRSPSR